MDLETLRVLQSASGLDDSSLNVDETMAIKANTEVDTPQITAQYDQKQASDELSVLFDAQKTLSSTSKSTKGTNNPLKDIIAKKLATEGLTGFELLALKEMGIDLNKDFSSFEKASFTKGVGATSSMDNFSENISTAKRLSSAIRLSEDNLNNAAGVSRWLQESTGGFFWNADESNNAFSTATNNARSALAKTLAGGGKPTNFMMQQIASKTDPRFYNEETFMANYLENLKATANTLKQGAINNTAKGVRLNDEDLRYLDFLINKEIPFLQAQHDDGEDFDYAAYNALLDSFEGKNTGQHSQNTKLRKLN